MENENRTLYMHIMEDLEHKISSNILKPGDKLPTELELAKLYNVSRTTSQRALAELERKGLIDRKRGKGSFVSSSRSANIHIGSNKIISIILPYSGPSGRLIEYINGASNYAGKNGYYLTIHTTDNDSNEEREALKGLIKNNEISGAIFYPTRRDNFDILYLLYLDNYPIVTIDKRFQSLPLSYVVSDNFNGGYKATSFLIENGHERIAYISTLPIEDISSIRERFFGYCSALKEHNVPIDTNLFCFDFRCQNNKADAKSIETLKHFLKDGVTAIFAEHDYIAISIYQTLQDMGVRVPEDISLMGFDNVEILEHLDIPLATINQNFYDIGGMAAKTVIDMIEHGYCDSRENIIPVELVVGESVANIKEQKAGL